MQEKEQLIRQALANIDAEFAFLSILKDNANNIYEEFILTISKDSYNLSNILGLSRSSREKIFSLLFEDLGRTRVDKYLLSTLSKRECKSCSRILSIGDFRPNAGRPDGLNSYCKYCQSNKTAETQPSRQAKYKAASIQRIVPWTDMESISAFYSKCPEGYQVDHIVPLQGEFVSGLHVINNLQYLTAEENIKKSNKYIAE